jgi:hypothetical protein
MRRTSSSLVVAAVATVSLGAPVLVPGTSAAQVTTASTATTVAPTTATDDRGVGRLPYHVRLTTFNILSSSIAPGGLDRARRAARWVQAQRADVAAFQEVAKDQLRTLQHVMPGYHFFPRRTLGTRGSAIQIAWKKDEVKILRTGYVMRPFLGHSRPIPYVRLRDRETGRGFFVMAIHNAPGGQEAERDISTRKEIRRIQRLLKTNRPVFVIGDVNERSEFCEQVARATPLISMNGGTRSRPCPVPRYGGPDWMMGAGAEYFGFKKDYNGISDHPALFARAKVPK